MMVFTIILTGVRFCARMEMSTIVAVHEKHLNCVILPCGNCRQMLFEYCPDIKVIVNDENGNLIKVKARDLLPFAWESVNC